MGGRREVLCSQSHTELEDIGEMTAVLDVKTPNVYFHSDLGRKASNESEYPHTICQPSAFTQNNEAVVFQARFSGS